MQYFKNLFVGLFLFLPFLSLAQVVDYIDVRLNIKEKFENQTRALPNAKLQISDLGQVQTDAEGKYHFNYAVRNNVDPEISISLISDEHKTLRPLDGSVSLDPSREEMTIEFLVVNVTKESPEFKKRIRDLERKIRALKSKDELTKRQLNALNQVLVDTLLYFEQNRKRMEEEMEVLNKEVQNLEELSEDQKQKIEGQKAKIVLLEEKVDQLTFDLEEALEKRYLRQNEYFKQISVNLNEYMQRLKDLRDQLPHIKEYFLMKGDFQVNYNSNLKKYNDAFTVLNTQHQDYLEGVERYWEKKALAKELDTVFEYLLSGVHARQMYPLVQELNNEIRRSRPNKAQKIATDYHEDLFLNIRKLEKDVNRTLSQLRINL